MFPTSEPLIALTHWGNATPPALHEIDKRMITIAAINQTCQNRPPVYLIGRWWRVCCGWRLLFCYSVHYGNLAYRYSNGVNVWYPFPDSRVTIRQAGRQKRSPWALLGAGPLRRLFQPENPSTAQRPPLAGPSGELHTFLHHHRTRSLWRRPIWFVSAWVSGHSSRLLAVARTGTAEWSDEKFWGCGVHVSLAMEDWFSSRIWNCWPNLSLASRDLRSAKGKVFGEVYTTNANRMCIGILLLLPLEDLVLLLCSDDEESLPVREGLKYSFETDDDPIELWNKLI